MTNIVSVASTGNVCTIRCFNEQNFGGCVAVQQTDVTPNVNSPATIATAQTLAGVDTQVAENKADLPAAMAANAAATSGTDQEQALLGANALLALLPSTTAATAATATKATSAKASLPHAWNNHKTICLLKIFTSLKPASTSSQRSKLTP